MEGPAAGSGQLIEEGAALRVQWHSVLMNREPA
jgi:hypothetical protein